MEFTSRRNREARPQMITPATITATRPAHPPRTSAARRLSFQTPSFYTRPSTTRDLFVPESPCRQYWGPGETLPHTSFDASSVETQPQQLDVHSLIQSMQTSIETNFQTLNSRLSEFEKRMDSMEEKLQVMPTQAGTHCSNDTSESCTRKRKNPPELQHQVRMIHASFDEEKQLRPDERINSSHNREVVSNIIREVGTDKFTAKQIQSAVVTYRSTRRHAAKGISEDVKMRIRIRSRQQRLFEKRSKVVKSREKTKWEKVTADMMSEEEEDDDGEGFVRHRYTWRSASFNHFIDKLEARISKKNKKSLAKKRCYGTPLDQLAPSHAKDWMKTTDERNDSGLHSEELISSGEEE